MPRSSYQRRPRSPSVTPPTLQPFDFQEIEHLDRRQFHLLAEPLGNDCDIDMFEQFLRIGAHAPAVERGENALGAEIPGIVKRCVSLMTVEVESPAALQVKPREVAEEHLVRGRAGSRACPHSAG